MRNRESGDYFTQRASTNDFDVRLSSALPLDSQMSGTVGIVQVALSGADISLSSLARRPITMSTLLAGYGSSDEEEGTAPIASTSRRPTLPSSNGGAGPHVEEDDEDEEKLEEAVRTDAFGLSSGSGAMASNGRSADAPAVVSSAPEVLREVWS